MTDPTRVAEAAERASKLIETIDRSLTKWRAWFPSEESIVDVPRADLLAVAELARDRLAELDPSGITPELLKADGWTGSDETEVYHLDGFTIFSIADGYWQLAKHMPHLAANIKTMGAVRTHLRPTRLTQPAAEAGKE